MDVMTLAARLTLNTSEFNSGLTQSEKKMSKMSSGTITLGNLTTQAINAAGRATKKLVNDTVETGKEFDAAMSQVRAIKDMSDEEFGRVRQKAMDLGASTKFTASEVAEGLYYMGLAGWDVEEMLEGIGPMLDLAAASGENLGTTSDIVTDALTAFGLSAKDTQHFVDVLAAASANSNTTVSMMGQAFKYLATNAGVLNYSIDDVAVTLGLLANNGIKSSQAGTSMRQIINTLIAPTDKAAAAMEKLGVSLFEAGTDKVKPLNQVLKEMREVFKNSDFNLAGKPLEEVQAQMDEVDAWYDDLKTKIEENGGTATDTITGSLFNMDDLEKEYKAKLQAITGFNEDFLGNLSAIGGLRGIGSILAIMKSSDEDFNQLVEAVENSEGAAGKMAGTMLDNLSGDITILNSALEGLKIVVSDSFKEDFRGFVQVLTEEIGKLNEAFKGGGVLGMFIEIADWIITGLADSLQNPNTEQVQSIGDSIGTFIGKVAARLLTDLPAMVGGVIELGAALASGLLEGLQKGLFGDQSEVQKFVDSMNAELKGIETNNIKAQGLLAYLQEMAEAGDANVTETEAWKTAVEQLEEVMPGAKEILEAEGATIEDNIEKLRSLTNEYRKKAIQQAMVNTLQKEYETLAEQGVEREKENVKIGVARNTRSSIIDTFQSNIQKYADNIFKGIQSGEYEDFNGEMMPKIENLLSGFTEVGGELVELSNLDADQLAGVLSDLTRYLEEGPGGENLWDTDQSFLSPEEITALNNQYTQAGADIEAANKKIAEINGEMDKTKSAISTTEKAVNTVTAELNADATGVSEAGANLVGAINEVANSIGGEGASHAKGLWSVPYDNYPALLHRGEMVLTKSQARQFREGGYGGSPDGSAIASAVTAAMSKVFVMLNGEKVGDLTTRRIDHNINASSYSKLRAMGG